MILAPSFKPGTQEAQQRSCHPERSEGSRCFFCCRLVPQERLKVWRARATAGLPTRGRCCPGCHARAVCGRAPPHHLKSTLALRYKPPAQPPDERRESRGAAGGCLRTGATAAIGAHSPAACVTRTDGPRRPSPVPCPRYWCLECCQIARAYLAAGPQETPLHWSGACRPILVPTPMSPPRYRSAEPRPVRTRLGAECQHLTYLALSQLLGSATFADSLPP
jgi:hypothetical protein